MVKLFCSAKCWTSNAKCWSSISQRSIWESNSIFRNYFSQNKVIYSISVWNWIDEIFFYEISPGDTAYAGATLHCSSRFVADCGPPEVFLSIYCCDSLAGIKSSRISSCESLLLWNDEQFVICGNAALDGVWNTRGRGGRGQRGGRGGARRGGQVGEGREGWGGFMQAVHRCWRAT